MTSPVPLADQTPLNEDNNPPASINNMVDSDQERQARYDAVPATMTPAGPMDSLQGHYDRAMGDSAARQAETEGGLNTPAGSGEFNVMSGTAPDWPAGMASDGL